MITMDKPVDNSRRSFEELSKMSSDIYIRIIDARLGLAQLVKIQRSLTDATTIKLREDRNIANLLDLGLIKVV